MEVEGTVLKTTEVAEGKKEIFIYKTSDRLSQGFGYKNAADVLLLQLCNSAHIRTQFPCF